MRLLPWSIVSISTVLVAGASIENVDAAYDYVIVGGGLTGLVTAARLSEDPDGNTILC
jgi:ribulose 1,5-bisphosphate synthetase/thiazole synthase